MPVAPAAPLAAPAPARSRPSFSSRSGFAAARAPAARRALAARRACARCAAEQPLAVAIPRPLGLSLGSATGDRGVVVEGVVEGSNAAREGTLRAGDVLTAVDGWQCAGEAFDDVLAVIAAGGEGEEVQLECARASDGALTNLAGRVHLAANAQEEGVTVSDSGLQYKVLENGNGARCTGVGQSCVVHYEGKLVNGTKFDSSYDRGKPATFKPKQVIAGWTEALLLMREGDVWEASLPCELGYGKRGSAPLIAPGDALIFKIELERVTA